MTISRCRLVSGFSFSISLSNMFCLRPSPLMLRARVRNVSLCVTECGPRSFVSRGSASTCMCACAARGVSLAAVCLSCIFVAVYV